MNTGLKVEIKWDWSWGMKERREEKWRLDGWFEDDGLDGERDGEVRVMGSWGGGIKIIDFEVSSWFLDVICFWMMSFWKERVRFGNGEKWRFKRDYRGWFYIRFLKAIFVFFIANAQCMIFSKDNIHLLLVNNFLRNQSI